MQLAVSTKVNKKMRKTHEPRYTEKITPTCKIEERRTREGIGLFLTKSRTRRKTITKKHDAISCDRDASPIVLRNLEITYDYDRVDFLLISDYREPARSFPSCGAFRRKYTWWERLVRIMRRRRDNDDYHALHGHPGTTRYFSRCPEIVLAGVIAI